MVELLASIIVIVAIGSIVIGMISSSLRGTNKTNTIENIRQNGDHALAQIAKDIEYALPFDGINTGLSNDNGATYVSSCPFDSVNPTPAPVVSNYILISLQSGSNFIKYRCYYSSDSSSELSANGISLIDKTSVLLKSCSFSCTQTRVTDVPIIKISFTLGPIIQNGLVENSNPPITFETSVTMRNYKE